MGAPIKLQLTFGDRLRRYRRAAHLTQEQLAERSGMSVRAISDLERGARQAPRRDTLRLLAEALGLSADEAAALEAAVVRLRGVGGGEGGAPGSTVSPVLPTADANQPLSPDAGAPDASSSAHSRPAPPPSGTVTFLFTDIEGSTRLLQQLGGPRYAEVLGEHQRLLRAAFAAHDGHEVDTQGDSFFVAFPTAPDALAAAAGATRSLAAHAWPEGVEALRVRMGLHSGAPQVVAARYVGLVVHRTARIAAAGHGGQILLSAAAAELARHDLPEGVTLRDLGVHRLKDLQQAERVYQAVLADVPNLPADFPPLKALDARPHNLPVQPSPILGREREVAAVSALLLRREDVRLVTLTGPGGVGKTRLSLQVAAESLDALDDFPDGVWHVRLSRLTDPTLVIPTIATTLDLKESGGTPLDEVLRGYLRDKRLLLVLDNFEQVVEAAPGVAELLESSPGVKALVTSRVTLHLRGEHEYALRPLALPDPAHLPPPERLAQYAAVALFIERAQAAQADFAVTNATAPAVAAICARLDGLPLAIELAAARVKLLPPPALLKRLERALPVLTGGARDLDARQQTMRNTLAWSYGLLAPEEQRLFRRLSVFVGGCTLEAAEAVCMAPDGAEPLGLDALDGLNRLVDHSLIQQREEGGEPRFGMLHVVREFSLEQLDVSREAEVLRGAHAVWCVRAAEDAREGMRRAEEEPDWLDRLEREHDNLRAAFIWALDRSETEISLRLAAAVSRFVWLRGHGREWQPRLEGVLAATPLDLADDRGLSGALLAGSSHDHGAPHLQRAAAAALYFAGMFAGIQGDIPESERWLHASITQSQQCGDHETAARALNYLGIIAMDHGDLAQAEALFESSLSEARLYDHSEATGLAGAAIGNLGEVAYARDDLARAEALYSEALTLHQQRQHAHGIGVQLVNLANVARRRSEFARACALAREGIAVAQPTGDPDLIAALLQSLAVALGSSGYPMAAARLFGAAGAAHERLGVMHVVENADFEAAMAPIRMGLGDEAWQTAYATGRALSLEEAVAEALGEAE